MLSVGVDIGSSTSHLVFSRIVLERLDSRYVVTERESFYQSDILLTPYSGPKTPSTPRRSALSSTRQYKDAKIDPDEIDTGALILTGVAVRRKNARAHRRIVRQRKPAAWSRSAPATVSKSVMAAYGSGAVARSIRNGAPVMNVDVGGGTAKIAVCADGKVIDVTALDIGARLVVLDARTPHRAARRSRPPLRRRAWARSSSPARSLTEEQARALAARMADRLFEAMRGGSPRAGGADLLRLDPLSFAATISDVSFSGGVSEYIYGGEAKAFGDIGPQLAAELRARLHDLGPATGAARRAHPRHRDRRLAIHHAGFRLARSSSRRSKRLPLRNVPVIAPELPLGEETIDSGAVAAAIKSALKRLDLGDGESPVAVFVCLARLGDVPAARRFLQRRRRRLASRARPRPSDRARRRRRCRRADRHPLSRGNEDRESDRLDRRPRTQRVRLYRHRRHPRHLGRRAGRHQIAGVSDAAPASARTGRRSRRPWAFRPQLPKSQS